MNIKLINLLILTLFLLMNPACTSKVTNNWEEGKVIFEFDEVEFYNLSIERSKESEIFKNANQKAGKFKFEVLSGVEPKNTNDPKLVEKMIEIGYSKYSVKKDSIVEQIQKSMKLIIPSKSQISTSCLPIYRDILILRKEKNIVGIAKICFDCQDHYFSGLKNEDERLIEAVHYGKLSKALKLALRLR